MRGLPKMKRSWSSQTAPSTLNASLPCPKGSPPAKWRHLTSLSLHLAVLLMTMKPSSEFRKHSYQSVRICVLFTHPLCGTVPDNPHCSFQKELDCAAKVTLEQTSKFVHTSETVRSQSMIYQFHKIHFALTCCLQDDTLLTNVIPSGIGIVTSTQKSHLITANFGSQ